MRVKQLIQSGSRLCDHELFDVHIWFEFDTQKAVGNWIVEMLQRTLEFRCHYLEELRHDEISGVHTTSVHFAARSIRGSMASTYTKMKTYDTKHCTRVVVHDCLLRTRRESGD
jgi:hypothetical protein